MKITFRQKIMGHAWENCPIVATLSISDGVGGSRSIADTLARHLSLSLDSEIRWNKEGHYQGHYVDANTPTPLEIETQLVYIAKNAILGAFRHMAWNGRSLDKIVDDLVGYTKHSITLLRELVEWTDMMLVDIMDQDPGLPDEEPIELNWELASLDIQNTLDKVRDFLGKEMENETQ